MEGFILIIFQATRLASQNYEQFLQYYYTQSYCSVFDKLTKNWMGFTIKASFILPHTFKCSIYLEEAPRTEALLCYIFLYIMLKSSYHFMNKILKFDAGIPAPVWMQYKWKHWISIMLPFGCWYIVYDITFTKKTYHNHNSNCHSQCHIYHMIRCQT